MSSQSCFAVKMLLLDPTGGKMRQLPGISPWSEAILVADLGAGCRRQIGGAVCSDLEQKRHVSGELNGKKPSGKNVEEEEE